MIVLSTDYAFRIASASAIEMRQHFLSHQIEARGTVPRGTKPDILESQVRQTADSLHDILGRSCNGKPVEEIIGQPQLIDELGVLAGFHPVLSIIILLVEPADIVPEMFGNLPPRKSGAQRMVARRGDARLDVCQRLFSRPGDAQPRSPPNL